MSTSALSFGIFIACVFNEIDGQITPTTSNATGSFYVASDYFNDGQYFQDGSITCNDLYCHIVCNVASSCGSLKVYAKSPSTTFIMQCIQSLSCHDSSIYANTANSVQLSCTYSTTVDSEGPCYNLDLKASNVKNDVTITCDGYNSCQSASFDVTDAENDATIICNGVRSCYQARFDGSNIGNSLTTTCSSDQACLWAYVDCPKDVWCNVHCLETKACSSLNIDVATKFKHKLNLDCAAWKCSLNINCDDNDGETQLTYSHSAWSCSSNDYECCLFEPGNITCPAAVSCQIDCDTQDCVNYHIDATLATSLVLDCGVNGCKGARIECPTGVSATCNIQCPGEWSCEYTYVDMASNKINHLEMNCTGEYSCRNVQLKLNSAEITKLDLMCSSVGSCYYLNGAVTSTAVIHALNINCKADIACHMLRFSSKIALEADIDCVNPSISFADEYWAACYGADFHIFGYNDNGNKISNISYSCGPYDCYEANVNVADFYRVDINCNGTNSCWESWIAATRSEQLFVKCSQYRACQSASIRASTSEQILIECLGNQGCQSASVHASTSSSLTMACTNYSACIAPYVYCPIAGSCNINCSHLDACNKISITITNKSYEGVHLSWYHYDYDDSAETIFHCTESREIGYSMWSTYYQRLVCNGNCCPSNNVSMSPSVYPSIYPTLNPSGNPSMNPTIYPTLNPSENPSTNPSSYPTRIPSYYPSIYPTSYPTLVPSTNPSSHPTLIPSNNAPNPSLNPSKTPSTQNKATTTDAISTENKNAMESASSNVNWDLIIALVVIFVFLLIIIISAGMVYYKTLNNKKKVLQQFADNLSNDRKGNIEMHAYLQANEGDAGVVSPNMKGQNNDDKMLDDNSL